MANLAEIRQQLQQAWMSDSNVINKFGITTTDTFESRFPAATYTAIIINVVAYIVWLREQALGDWKSDIDLTALSTRYGTKEWWRKVCLAWQYGSDSMLAVSDGKVIYEIIDEDAKRVKFVALNEYGKTLQIKVAKGTVGALEPLSQEELTSFEQYVSEVKPLGIKTQCLSLSPDIIQIEFDIYYDGELDANTVRANVEASIREYFYNVVFGGVIYRTKIVDAAQSVEGVNDVVIKTLNVGLYDGNFLLPMGRNYKSQAGYMQIDNIQLNLIVENE
jgi:hypothetical protein